MPRVYERKFDWDEARRLHDGGLTYAEIARRLGVSNQSIRYACVPGEYERMLTAKKALQASGVCPDCGTRTTRMAGGRSRRCKDCAAKAAVRMKDGNVWCPTCKQWKPLRAFSPSRSGGGRPVHNECKSCQAERRREWRARKRAEGVRNP